LVPDLPGLGPVQQLAEATNSRGVTGGLHDELRDLDVIIGVSTPGSLDPAWWIKDMASRSIVVALANPDPEVDTTEASMYVAVVASGRSEYPNQINHVLAFPGVFRGLLEARATVITVGVPPRRTRRRRRPRRLAALGPGNDESWTLSGPALPFSRLRKGRCTPDEGSPPIGFANVGRAGSQLQRHPVGARTPQDRSAKGCYPLRWSTKPSAYPRTRSSPAQ
jgi:hypothetical protein